MAVDTAKVEGRRKVRLESYEELLAEVDRLSSGPVKTLGNWSPGQIYSHLARAYNGSIDGFTMTFPIYLRVMARLFRNRLLTMSMPAGFKLPAAGAKALVAPATSTEEGAAELRAAVARLQHEPPKATHPLFGNLSEKEWERLHLGHACLHLSFLVPQNS